MIKRISFGEVDPSPAAHRVAVCTVLPDLTPDVAHDRVLLEWFDDLPEPNGAPCMVVDEHVVRGADWLDQRWRAGGPRLKHMALAARAPDLTAEEFSERWRRHAGSVGTTPIPEVARGQAYVQDHPLPGDWAYDAVTEVWFDDEAGLRARIAFFDEVGIAGAGDLVRDASFLAVREDPF